MKTTMPLVLALLLMISSASCAHAAALSIESSPAAAETTFTIPVLISSEKAINVVEGSILIPDGMVIERISTGDSAFSLFASGPRYVPASHSIEFTAGAPKGISAGTPARLFVIYARAATPGAYTLTPEGIRAYENDGKGTLITPNTTPMTIVVGEKGSVKEVARPKETLPPLIADIGKDTSLFQGKWYLTFYGGSDVAYYLVREGWWQLTPKRADRYYVLQDQSLHTPLWVTSITADGTKYTTYVPASHPWPERIFTLLLCILAGGIAFLLYIRMRRRTT